MLVAVPDTKVVWVLLAARHMPPILFNRSVLFPNRSITRCLEHAGDRQIFDFTMSGAPGSTYQGRRHAAEALYGEAAKRPSLRAETTKESSEPLFKG